MADSGSSGSSGNIWASIINGIIAYKASQDAKKTAQAAANPGPHYEFRAPYGNDLIASIMPLMLQEATNLYKYRAGGGGFSGKGGGPSYSPNNAGIDRIISMLNPYVSGEQRWDPFAGMPGISGSGSSPSGGGSSNPFGQAPSSAGTIPPSKDDFVTSGVGQLDANGNLVKAQGGVSGNVSDSLEGLKNDELKSFINEWKGGNRFGLGDQTLKEMGINTGEGYELSAQDVGRLIKTLGGMAGGLIPGGVGAGIGMAQQGISAYKGLSGLWNRLFGSKGDGTLPEKKKDSRLTNWLVGMGLRDANAPQFPDQHFYGENIDGYIPRPGDLHYTQTGSELNPETGRYEPIGVRTQTGPFNGNIGSIHNPVKFNDPLLDNLSRSIMNRMNEGRMFSRASNDAFFGTDITGGGGRGVGIGGSGEDDPWSMMGGHNAY